MITAEHYRTQAAALYQLSRHNPDRAAAFAQILKAADYESKAEKLERGEIDKDE